MLTWSDVVNVFILQIQGNLWDRSVWSVEGRRRNKGNIVIKDVARLPLFFLAIFLLEFPVSDRPFYHLFHVHVLKPGLLKLCTRLVCDIGLRRHSCWTWSRRERGSCPDCIAFKILASCTTAARYCHSMDTKVIFTCNEFPAIFHHLWVTCSDPFASEEETEVCVQHFDNFFQYDGGK